MTMKRNADGSYSGSYKGHDFTVRKEQVERAYGDVETIWVATSGNHTGQSSAGFDNNTRKSAISSLVHELELEAQDVPEVDAMLGALMKKWAMEIEAVASNLDAQDVLAQMELQGLRAAFDRFERHVRQSVMYIERDLARFRSRSRTRALAGGGK